MDIAGLSVAMNQQRLHMDAGLAVMGHVKDMAQQEGQELIDMLDQSMPSHPTLGNSIDISG